MCLDLSLGVTFFFCGVYVLFTREYSLAFVFLTVYACVCVFVCPRVRVSVCEHVCVCLFECVHLCVYVFVFVCVFVYVCLNLRQLLRMSVFDCLCSSFFFLCVYSYVCA